MNKSLFRNILNAWKGVSIVSIGKRLELSPYLHADELESLKERITACLESKGGEVTARARAAELGQAYLDLNDEGRTKFLKVFSTDYGVNHDKVRTTAEALFTDLSPEERTEVEESLRAALTPKYMTLLTQFNALPQGIKFLVDLRSDVMRLSKENPELKPIDEVLHKQLSSWFDIGFLELKQIDWNAPASLLEKLIEYEAVHKVKSWDDLHHRLGANRRCFAFFHPRMPGEPLIFVWVALVEEISDNVNQILDEKAEEFELTKPTTAIFYSISSAQKGLAGVSLGNYLIKRVVDELKRTTPTLDTFATLSPAPGFSRWIKAAAKAKSDELSLFNDEEREELRKLGADNAEDLLTHADWLEEESICQAMEAPLNRMLATYIATEKRSNGNAANPVAHFHLSNGAIFERINWKADSSTHGVQQSYGMMVNYLYDLDSIAANHESYVGNGTVAQSKNILNLYT